MPRAGPAPPRPGPVAHAIKILVGPKSNLGLVNELLEAECLTGAQMQEVGKQIYRVLALAVTVGCSQNGQGPLKRERRSLFGYP